MKIKQFVKKYRVVIIGLILLVIFGIVGQLIHKGTSDSQVSESKSNTNESVDEDGAKEQSFDIFKHIEILQATETQDNPWGKTAGIFEMEDIGKCILLTPNTGFQINDVSSSVEVLSFRIKIHPWVAELSDGAGLRVWLQDEGNNTVYEDDSIIENNSVWAEISINPNKYENVKNIQIMCDNGIYDNDDGDWVLIKILDGK